MNSKSRSSAACWAEPPPVETGLSVDDRPNELNIAFWVISSVGAVSPLLLHIIYVSVHATSLSFPLYLSFFHFTPPHTNTSLSLSLALCVAYSIFLSHSLFISSLHSVFFPPLHLSSLPFCPLVSLFPHFFSLSLFPSVSLYCVYHSLTLLFYSFLSLRPFVSFLPSLSSSLFFCLTLSKPFSLKLSFPLSLSFTPLPLKFLSLFPSLSFLSHAYEVA